MVKSELIQIIAFKQPNLTKEDVEAAVNCIFNRIHEELGRGGRIEIRGFGTFSVRQHEAKWVVIPERVRLCLFPESIAFISNQELN